MTRGSWPYWDVAQSRTPVFSGGGGGRHCLFTGKTARYGSSTWVWQLGDNEEFYLYYEIETDNTLSDYFSDISVFDIFLTMEDVPN